ncbi:MAG TPA: acetate--CoA ligase family protein [Acidimicrobiales bacterium]
MPPTLDVTGRPVQLRELDLARFFRPRSLAVIGASDTEGRPNTGVWRRLAAWADVVGADVVPVNPTKDTVDGRRSYPSIIDVPGDVDVAVILVGNATEALQQAIEKKASFAVIFASGFAEVGEEGRAAQDSLGDIVGRADIHLLGPNTNLNAFETFRDDLGGPAIAMITQSGHQGRPIFQSQEIGIRLNYWAPTGNEVDLEFADFAKWFVDQDGTGAVAAYIEGFKDGRTLMLAADHAVRRGVPIVCVKVGRTEEGASMASSHTGKLAGSDAVTSAVFRQFGVTRVDGLDEVIDTAQLLARGRPPTTDGVVIYAISGGTGAHMADLCASAGLRLPVLSAELQEKLYQWIPRFLRVSNPVDNGGHPVGDERGRKILDALVADPDVGVIVAPITGAFAPMSDKLAQDLVDVAETTDKPICVVWGSPVGTEAAYRDILLSSSKVAVFRTFGNCVTAVKAWLDWHEFAGRYKSPFAKPVLRASKAAVPARALIDGCDSQTALTEHESKLVLAEYGIPVTREQVVTSSAQAVRAAAMIGYPVVLKASSADVLHKSDLGLVRIGLSSAKAVRDAYAAIAPHSDGAVLVSEMVEPGVEVVIGVSHDEMFGPVVMAGLGGVFVEVLGDVSFRVPPFDKSEARRMIDELRGAALLRGARGRPAADIAAFADVIMRVQRLAVDLSADIDELDLNPLVLHRKGAVALDALLVPRIR